MLKKTRILLPFYFVCWILTGFSGINSRGISYDEFIISGGLKRSYLLHIPPSFESNISRPLLVVLHGGGGSGKDMVKLTRGRFDELSDKKSFIVVYPDGIDKHWNDGRKSGSKRAWGDRSEIDDTGFISVLIDHLIHDMKVDPRRVYVTGMSNGAIMSYRLACELSDKIAAIAPVAGNIPENIMSACYPVRPVSLLAINSLNDPLVPYGGGEVTGPYGWRKLGKVLSASQSVKFWAGRDKCSAHPVIAMEPDLDPEDGTRIRKETFQDGEKGTEVILYTIEGGGHTWPGGYQYLSPRIVGKTCRDMNAADVIWDFFDKHARQ